MSELEVDGVASKTKIIIVSIGRLIICLLLWFAHKTWRKPHQIQKRNNTQRHSIRCHFALLKKWKVFHRFRCARALTLHTLAQTRWRILRRPAPVLFPRKLSVVSPNDHTKHTTIRFNFTRYTSGTSSWRLFGPSRRRPVNMCVFVCLCGNIKFIRVLSRIASSKFYRSDARNWRSVFLCCGFLPSAVAVFLHFVIKIKLWMAMRMVEFARTHTLVRHRRLHRKKSKPAKLLRRVLALVIYASH